MENGSQSSAICRLRVVHLRQCSGSRRSRSVAGLTLAAISRRSRPAASRRVNFIAAILERAGDRDGPALPGAGPSAAAQDTAGAKAAAASIGLSCSRTMPPVADTAGLCSGVRADFEPRSRPRRRWHRSDGTGCFAFGTVDRATGAAPSSKRRRLRPHPWRVPAAAVQPSQRGVHLVYLHLGNPCQRKETGAAHALCPGCVAIRRVDWFTPRGMIRRWLR